MPLSPAVHLNLVFPKFDIWNVLQKKSQIFYMLFGSSQKKAFHYISILEINFTSQSFSQRGNKTIQKTNRENLQTDSRPGVWTWTRAFSLQDTKKQSQLIIRGHKLIHRYIFTNIKPKTLHLKVCVWYHF